MDFEDLPGRIFLDTSVVNFILDHGEAIFDGVELRAGISKRVREDVTALEMMFKTGQRASWQLAVSPLTYREVVSTTDPVRRHYVERWFLEVWHYWLTFLKADETLRSLSHAEQIRVEVLASGVLDILPDIGDRVLLCDALAYGCDCFCTRDWRTILRHREHLETLPLLILRPTDWWRLIRPWAAIWY